MINHAKERSQDWLSRRIKLVEEYKPLQIREERRCDELVALVESNLFAEEELSVLQQMNMVRL
ncbi:hypothetical protein EON65_20010 [archaeon]|nr:MAG: hypothetical protein EON65_20010 [archaeon]